MSAPPPDLAAHLAGWHPEPCIAEDTLAAAPVAALSATLDLPRPAAVDGEALPPLWHWLHFLHWPARSELGPDGHPLHGHFLPPVPNRRRMFAGGRLEVHAPLVVGEPTERTDVLERVRVTRGRSGEMVFVTVRSELRQRGRAHLVEEQDLVYRSGEDTRRTTVTSPSPAEDAPATDAQLADDPWRLRLDPTPTLLFRLSALTANSHRIHYDRPYATEVEGYPELVVHGPLLALLMAELLRRNAPDRPLARLSYRLRRPVFAGDDVHALGGPAASDTQPPAEQDELGEPHARLRIATRRAAQHATAEAWYA